MRLLLALFFALWAAPAFSQGSMMPDIVNDNPPVASGGCSGAGTTAANNYLARTTGGNEGGNAANVTTLICGLVTDGVITGNLSGAKGCGSHLDTLYILAQQNSSDALLNLCGTTYGATVGGTPTFTSNVGYSGFNAGTYVDSNFNSTTATSPNYIQNNASFGFWSYAVISETNPQMGTGNDSHIYDDYSGTSFYARVNDSVAPSVSTTITKGLFTGDRTNSTTVFPYQNGSSGGSISSSSTVNDNNDFLIGFVPGLGAGATGQTICAAYIGGSLGSSLQAALYTRLRTYMTAMGVP